jgi:hypothetical protein
MIHILTWWNNYFLESKQTLVATFTSHSDFFYTRFHVSVPGYAE